MTPEQVKVIVNDLKNKLDSIGAELETLNSDYSAVLLDKDSDYIANCVESLAVVGISIDTHSTQMEEQLLNKAESISKLSSI